MGSLSPPTKYAETLQPSAQVEEIPPIQNQWYELLDAEGGVRVHRIMIYQENDEVAAKVIAWSFIIDGETIAGSRAVANDSEHYGYYDGSDIEFGTDPRIFGMVAVDTDAVEDVQETIPTTDFMCTFRMTDAPGTNQVMRLEIWYSLKEAV